MADGLATLDWLPDDTMTPLEAALAYRAHGLRPMPIFPPRRDDCACPRRALERPLAAQRRGEFLGIPRRLRCIGSCAVLLVADERSWTML